MEGKKGDVQRPKLVPFTAILHTFLVIGIIFGGIFGLVIIGKERSQPKTIEVSIEYLWEEEREYYFADENGFVYMIGNLLERNEEILYDDMPKQRFKKLKEGGMYDCLYLPAGSKRISVSEREIEE